MAFPVKISGLPVTLWHHTVSKTHIHLTGNCCHSQLWYILISIATASWPSARDTVTQATRAGLANYRNQMEPSSQSPSWCIDTRGSEQTPQTFTLQGESNDLYYYQNWAAFQCTDLNSHFTWILFQFAEFWVASNFWRLAFKKQKVIHLHDHRGQIQQFISLCTLFCWN